MSSGEPHAEILLSGATGLIGGRLLPVFGRLGSVVRALTRRPDATRPIAAPHRWVGWDGLHFSEEAVAGAASVVHLAGEPVFAGRLTAARRARILTSRVESTRSLAQTLAALAPAQRPRVFLCASAVGYYGSRDDELLDEDAAPGEGFLADVCRAWEAEARSVEALGIRCVSLRIGIVLAREGGALPRMALPFRLGLGGRLGDGQQWFPWIHIDDVTALIGAALSDATFVGALNAVAPAPVRNAELTRMLASVLHRPAWLAVPAFVLQAALGDLAIELLGSRRCQPQRALAHGFRFAHPRLETALAAELG